MTNVQDAYSTWEDLIEEFVGVADEWNDVNSRPSDDLRRRLRVLCDMRDDPADAQFYRGSHGCSEGVTVRGYFEEIGCRAPAELDLHARRNVLNAASTS